VSSLPYLSWAKKGTPTYQTDKQINRQFSTGRNSGVEASPSSREEALASDYFILEPTRWKSKRKGTSTAGSAPRTRWVLTPLALPSFFW